MPPDWKKIRDSRDDISDWLIHWTHSKRIDEQYNNAFEVLKIILKCGYLIPTLAPKRSRTGGDGKERSTIKGTTPAVCFTDQPLGSFVRSCRALPRRYFPYAIAVRKDNLYQYGGRPVIYGDKSQLDYLPDTEKYLWMQYDPIPSGAYMNYPFDWTHEREWRVKVKQVYYREWGLTPNEGVPLVLPPVHCDGETPLPLPYIIVKSDEEADELRKWISELPEYEGQIGFIGQGGFIKKYYEHRNDCPIIAMNKVEEEINSGNREWGKLDTFPMSKNPLLLK